LLGRHVPEALDNARTERVAPALTPAQMGSGVSATSRRFRETKYGKPLAEDSHRNILAEAKTFLKWCTGKGYLRGNPLEGVQGTGKRRHGKPQLRIDEARKWQAKAEMLADEGDRFAWQPHSGRSSRRCG
jgi:hypothetical protein